MKKYINIIRTAIVFAAMAISASCIKVDIVVPAPEESQVSLTFKCSDIAQTRATEPGEGTYNENDIKRLDIFFYALDAKTNAAAKFHMTIDDLDEAGTYVYNSRIETTVIEGIFGKGTNASEQAKIYAIANLPDDVTFPEITSVDNLKKMVIETESFAGKEAQTSFVMDSNFDENAVVSYDSSTRIIGGTIKLYRAASKIGLFISQVKEVNVLDENGEIVKDGETPRKWKAFTNQMTVKLSYGVKKTCLDNTVSPYAVGDDDYFTFTSENARKMQIDGSQWKQDLPFYSYPSDWNADNSGKEAYLTLMVPWAMSNQLNADGTLIDGQQMTNTYYQIPINTQYKNLVRNTYYKINLVVSRLGSLVEEVPVVITPASYIILDWTTMNIDASLQDYRYLVVDQKEYTIYNQEELYIPFRSSHETEIVSVDFKQQDLSNKYASAETWNEITKGSAKYYNALDIKDGQIYYKNDLDNVYISNTFDFTPYKLTFTIRHKETQYQNIYYENITVIQYPAIYGVPYTNSDWENNNNPSASANNDNNGYVFVNGYNDDTDRGTQDFFCSAPGFGNTEGSPNMFVFNITSVSGTDYVVGDPRENVIDENFINQTHNQNNRNYSIWDTAPALYEGASERTLKYYYATDVDYTSSETMMNSRTRNMIAPQFRIASAYGVLQPTAAEAKDLQYLKKRCASYQEDGYPAGRWRLPTEAEFRFIISQVNKTPATLPALYITTKNYWCAHGLGTVNGATVTMTYTTTSDGNSTRCVYDTWYWGNEPIDDPSVFTWGDMPR